MLVSPGKPRSAIRTFGRRLPAAIVAPQAAACHASDDARLFLTTFLAGLLFMTVYLA